MNSMTAVGASGPMALLVLLAGPAPAGIVAPDLLVVGLDDRDRVLAGAIAALRHVRRAAGGRLRRRCDRRARRRGLGQRRGLLGAAAGVRDAGRRPRRLGLEVGRLDGDLDVEDDAGELLPDRVHELAEHLEALVLVGDERVDLGEPAKVDPLAEVVHLVEVLAPAVVDDLQQDLALEEAHELLAQLLLAAGVGAAGVLGEQRGDLLAVRAGVFGAERGAERPQLPGLRLEAGEVPLLEDLALRVLEDEALDHGAPLLADDVGHVAALEDLAAVLVDDAALLVEDVVVLEDSLADQEVLLLDLLLGVLDLLREHLRLEGVLLALLVDGPQPVEDLEDPVAGEQADEVVLGGEEEAGLAGIALAARPAAKLVVDPPGLVALGAADEEAARLT